jgi:hypothetical protein
LSKFKVGDIVRTKTKEEIAQWLCEHDYDIPFGWNDAMGVFASRTYRVMAIRDRCVETDTTSCRYRLEDMDDPQFNSNRYRVNYFSWSWPMLALLDDNL